MVYKCIGQIWFERLEIFENGDLLSRFKRVYIRRRREETKMVVMKVDSGELEADECEAVKQRNQNNETSFIETVFPSRQASISFDREIASTCSANRTIRYRSFYHATKHTKKRRKRGIVVQVIFAMCWYINYTSSFIFPFWIFPFLSSNLTKTIYFV